MSDKAYQNLKQRFARIIKLQTASNILSKDADTVMPSGASVDRVEQQQALGMVMHDLISAPEVSDWLDEAESNKDDLSREDKRNLELMRHRWIHSASLPDDLAEEVAKLGSEGQVRHNKYYKTGTWADMKDWYAHSFKIMREVGQAKQELLGASTVYEALVDQFSPGIKTSLIDREFKILREVLSIMIPAALDRQAQQDNPLPLKGPFPAGKQLELGQRVAKLTGFDFDRGRLYMIHGHPSSGGSRNDSRITTRCNEGDFLHSAATVAHEAGHGIYEQNCPEDWRWQPVGQDLGMAIHESQSMIMDWQTCGLPEYFEWLERQAREIFDEPSDPSFKAENLERLVNRANPGLIRVEADELTYSVHVIMRYELERDIISGTLDPADLTDAWNAKLNDALGLVPPDPTQGCMQDVHWPCGYIGYFPAYTLGAMGAAQFFAAAVKTHGDIPREIGKGDGSTLKNWLVSHVHSKASFVTADELYTAATGEILNVNYYLDHLSRRFLGEPYEQGEVLTKTA